MTTQTTHQIDIEEQQQAYNQAQHQNIFTLNAENKRLEDELRKEREEKRNDRILKVIDERFNKLDNKIDTVKKDIEISARDLKLWTFSVISSVVVVGCSAVITILKLFPNVIHG